MLGSIFGCLSSAYLFDQNLMKLSASSCSSFTVWLSFLLCCSLILLISFQLSVVFAIICSILLGPCSSHGSCEFVFCIICVCCLLALLLSLPVSFLWWIVFCTASVPA